MKLQDIYHLYRRAAFGIHPSEAKALTSLSREEVVEQLIAESDSVTPLHIDLPDFDEFFAGDFEGKTKKFRELVRNNAPKHIDYNQAWVSRLCSSKERLNERMTLFWTNHFVVRDNAIYYSVQYRNTLRKHALGNFK